MESLESYISLGLVQNRQGLLYGPFTPIYGTGALLLSMFRPLLRNRRPTVIYAAAMLIATGLEYTWSLTQELLCGAVFWDYGHLPFQANGRVNLIFSLFWGLLGLVFLKLFYTPFFRFIYALPQLGRALVTGVLALLLLGNITLSSCALFRQRARQLSVTASSHLEVFLDEAYPDEYLRERFPGMRLRPGR